MDVFQLTDTRLSFLISDDRSPQQYLWSQIELCAHQSNFELCEGLIDVWLNNCDDYHQSMLIIAQFLVKCFQQNHNIWFIYQIIKKYNFHELINENELQLRLLLINGFDANQTQLDDIIEISKCDDLSTLDDKYLSFLRNLILEKPKMAQLVINLLTDNERLNYLYSQCLIHALRNHNKRLMLDILSVFPDQQINESNSNLLEEVYNEFSSDNSEQQTMLLYRSCILRKTTKLIDNFCNISRMRNKALVYDCSSQKFNFKECFLLAAYHNKHFINEMLDDSNICFHLPPKQRLFFLIYNLHKSDLKVERFIKIESEINCLINNCDEIGAFCEKDSTLEVLVKRLRIIIKFSNWCANQLKPNSDSQIHFAIFQSLFLGESPLKVLRKYGFLGEKDNVNINGDNTDQICDFLRDFDEIELMIYRGFLAIRFSIMWIILADDKIDENDFGERISLLLKNIHPLAYKVEILENIFSLLFLTQNELKDSDIDCDYCEDSTRKDLLSKLSISNTTIAASFGSTYFLCPNILVPKLLSLLKEAASDAQTTQFTNTYNNVEEPKINIDVSIKDSAECKTRIERLMLYINEAQWRFSVIEPAFSKDLSFQESKKSKSLLSSDGSDDDIMDDMEFMRSLSSTSGSESERKQPKEIFSSLICCMLASPIQLLRYSLIKNQFERANQVVKLFEQSLIDTEEAKELAIIENWRDLSTNLSALSASTKASNVNVSKIGQIAGQTGLKSTQIQSQIQSAIHEFLFKLDVNDLIKNSLIIDFALTSSHSMETSKVILETILQNPNLNDILPEKVTLFLAKIYSFISEISKELDVNKLTFANVFTHYTQCNSFCDAISYIEDKRTKTKIKIAYDDLRNHLIDLEYKNEDMSLKKSISNSESKKTTILFEKLLRVCPTANYNYLKALFYYVRKMSKSLYECQLKSSNSLISSYAESSYFSILKQSPSAILCSMILKDNISPKIVDDFAKEMKVDLIGTLCSVLCPQIPTHFLNESPAEFVVIDTSHPALCELIEVHLRGDKKLNCDLESVMIQNHFDDETDASSSLTKPKIRNNELISYFKIKCPIIVELMKLFKLIDEEEYINFDFKFKSDSPLIRWVEMVKEKFIGTPSVDYESIITLALSPRILVGHTIVNKTLEFCALKANLLEMYDIFKYIDESISFSVPNPSYKALKNAVLSRLAIEQEDVKYALQIIDDPQTKCDVILQLVNTSKIFSDSDIALRNINTCLDSLDFETQFSSQDLISLKQKLIAKCKEIEFYVKIGNLTGLRKWTDAKYDLTSIDILTIIKSKKKYSMSVEWNDIRGIETETSDLHYELLIMAYCESNDITALTQILSILDENINHSLTLITKIINLIDNLKFRRFLVEYVIEHYSNRLDKEQHEYYTNYLLGVKIIETVNVDVRPHYINLLTKPFVLIEQMLMNVEVESLEIAIFDLKLVCVDFLIEKYAQKAVEIQIYDASSSGNSIISDATIISSSLCHTQAILSQFVMPVSIPTREQWVPDSKVLLCMICKTEKFSMLNRRHHCRRCGRVVCANCSVNTLVIPEINANALVRVCDECYIQTHVNNRKDINSSLSITSNRRPQTAWFLTCDELHNDSVRLEFYYESSPSVSLCLTLLNLHSDRNRCSNIIVDSICKPLLETISSNQVDYGLVIGMIRSLLVSISSSPEHSSYELRNKVNFISSRMDTIRILINSNCNTKELISHALSNSDNSILKLQEKLIEMEQFELAIEIATKFGFDSNSILKTWAFVCLRNGQFSEAKQKFKNCLNVKNQTEIKKILNDIINILSKQNTLYMIKIDKEVYKEIIYYLEEYGQNDDSIKFYAKNSLWKKAIDLFLDNPNLLTNKEVFIHHLFMPAVKKGALLSLLKLLKPERNRFLYCISKTCEFLEKERLLYVLYDLLIFMDDHLKAATILIKLYLFPAVSNYIELYNRIDNLEKAINHCTDYVSQDENCLPKGCLRMENSHVLKLNRTINLQKDITIKFHEKRINGFLPFNAHSERYDNTPPTLFDNSKARKTELAALVISSYDSVDQGFKKTLGIITDHELEADQVFRLAARVLTHTHNSNIKNLLPQLLNCITGTYPTMNCDEIIFAAAESCANKVDAELLIHLLSDDSRKIDAFIISGLLRKAYLLAVHLNSETDVMRINTAAQQMNQPKIGELCRQWISYRSTGNIG